MKKLILLSFLLAFAVAVSAQFTAVPEGCLAKCKLTCEAEKMTGEQCDNFCNKVCNPLQEPVEVMPAVMPEIAIADCGTLCKISFDKCLRSGRSQTTCARLYDMCSKRCQTPSPVLTCEGKCDSAWAECKERGMTAIGAVGPECDRMRKECYRECRPRTCEQGCNEELKTCLGETVGISSASVKAVCRKKHLQCMQEKCGEQPEPKCPEVRCQKCVDVYGECAKSGRGPQTCRQMLVDCVDDCFGIERLMTCEEKCHSIKEECKAANIDEESCTMKIKDCLDGCPQKERPAPPSRCEDKCEQIKEECKEAGIDEESCGAKVSECMRLCTPGREPEKPDCRKACMGRYEKCLDMDIAPETCKKDAESCMAECGPQQIVGGAVTRPEAPPKGFFARFWNSLFG